MSPSARLVYVHTFHVLCFHIDEWKGRTQTTFRYKTSFDLDQNRGFCPQRHPEPWRTRRTASLPDDRSISLRGFGVGEEANQVCSSIWTLVSVAMSAGVCGKRLGFEEIFGSPSSAPPSKRSRCSLYESPVHSPDLGFGSDDKLSILLRMFPSLDREVTFFFSFLSLFEGLIL